MKTSLLPISKAKTAYGLLSDVCKVILAEPKRVFMPAWGGVPGNKDQVLQGFGLTRLLPNVSGPECGTIGCIGGWSECLLRDRPGADGRRQDVFEIFKFTSFSDGAVFTQGLFYLLYMWAVEDTAYGTRAYATAVVKKIRRFQKTHAKHLKSLKIGTAA